MKRLLFAIAVAARSASAVAEWTPPEKANAEQAHAILAEAFSDTRNGSYADSLAKHLWYHQHALKIDPASVGSRLVPALMDWYELAKAYPPAMAKLKETRDDAVQQVIDGTGDVLQEFQDVAAINEILGVESQTADVFLRLDKESPATAKKAYHWAQPALVKAKAYKLCGKYLDSKGAFDLLKDHHEQDLEFNAQKKEWRLEDRKYFDESTEARFLQESAVLVALLKLNGKGAEARRISDESGSICKHAKSKAVLDAALKGQMPELNWEKFRQ
jgi:hypothetical protein